MFTEHLIPTKYTAQHNTIWDVKKDDGILTNKELTIFPVIQDALHIN